MGPGSRFAWPGRRRELTSPHHQRHAADGFAIDQVPEMARGRGVRLQKYRDGGLSDVATFDSGEGFSWKDSAGREFSATMKELSEWRGTRADAGRLPPKGFPKSNKFGHGVE